MKNMLFITTLAAAMVAGSLTGIRAAEYELTSPDGRLQMNVTTAPSLSYAISYDSNAVVNASPIALSLQSGEVWNGTSNLLSVDKKEHNGKVYPLFGKNKEIADCYNELTLSFDGGYAVCFRLYNEGAAYRFLGERAPADSLVIADETAVFDFADDPGVILPETNNYTSWELSHKLYDGVSDIKEGVYGITPMLFDNKMQHYKVVVAEADLHDYPGLYLRKTDGKMQGHWAAYPKRIEMGSWGNFITVVKEREPYIARTAGDHAFPWRIVIVTDDDRTLLNNEIIYLLAKPQQIADTDWIRPGKATWEWWHCHILEDAPFDDSNLSTELYKYYIDFAAENGIEYLLVDAGWSNVFNHADLNKNVDIKEVIRYGKEKNVGVWLWTVAATLFQNKHVYLDSIAAWGAAGVKIDFFDRDDADVMPEYEELARACAERHLMVDFHGCSKPTGLHRAYPNILTYEAMRGAECAKWDTTSNPVYQLQFIFTRMLGGGTDYTPGSMRNVTREKFKPVDPGLPSTLGTRCHDLALYLLIESPFAMLADSPDAYRKYPDVLKFLSAVPTVWDKTVPLLARVGEYAVVARQSGEKWYVGGINDWTRRNVVFDLSFLPQGTEYEVEIFKDVKKSDTDASRYKREVKRYAAGETISMEMAQGGGFVMVFTPIK